MKIPPRKAGPKRPTADEIKGLERALDKAYARLRERARTEWLRHHGGKADPADARVSVRVTTSTKLGSEVPAPAKPTTRLLLRKPRKPRRKIPRAKARHRK